MFGVEDRQANTVNELILTHLMVSMLSKYMRSQLRLDLDQFKKGPKSQLSLSTIELYDKLFLGLSNIIFFLLNINDVLPFLSGDASWSFESSELRELFLEKHMGVPSTAYTIGCSLAPLPGVPTI